MEPFTAFLGAVFASILVLGIGLLRRRSGEDMIARQKRKTIAQMDTQMDRAPSGHHGAAPDNRRSDVEALLAIPEIRQALEKRRKIEAIKLVRERAGLGLKEAKDIVDRAVRK